MGKIIWKSALSFAGLAVVSWLLMVLDEVVISLETSSVALLPVLTLLPYIYWFLLTAAYAFALFRLFVRGKGCCLIVALNGLFVLLQFFAFNLARVPSGILALSTRMMQAGGAAVMLLAFVFKLLLSDKKPASDKVPGRAANAARIILETIMGLGLFAILAFETYALTRSAPAPILQPFWQERFVWLMAAVIYDSVLYLLFRRQYHVTSIMVVNAVLLAAVWCMVLIPDAQSPLSALFPDFKPFLCGLAGSASILTVALAIIFKRAESLHATHKAALRKSFDYHRPDYIEPVM